MSEFYFWYMKSMPNRSGLVQKDVTVTREGTTFIRRQWVRPDEAESTQKFTKEELAKIYHEFTSNSVDGHTYACRVLKESGFHWEESPSLSENWKRAKVALEHTIDLVFFPNGDKSISSRGQNKFDIEVAKKEYLKYLKNFHEKSIMWLDYYTKNTEYILDTKLSRPFGYSIKDDVIYYNTAHKHFGEYSFSVVNTHELAHRIDALNFHSWENKEFANSIKISSEIVFLNYNYYSSIQKESIFKNVFMSDIMSALSDDKLDCSSGHSSSYWRNNKLKSAEIFANLFSLESFKAFQQIKFIQKYFPALYSAYINMVNKI